MAQELEGTFLSPTEAVTLRVRISLLMWLRVALVKIEIELCASK
jgi:hypothetical protein